ncbi:uncharacterized protein METZ01_LOCUS118934 [marine metagenome]|uniref:Uncharacterized protein n=1 Tax=marine metagenome TaxID=408172 RepID=A0A381XN56_9ZZZZ
MSSPWSARDLSETTTPALVSTFSLGLSEE